MILEAKLFGKKSTRFCPLNIKRITKNIHFYPDKNEDTLNSVFTFMLHSYFYKGNAYCFWLEREGKVLNK